MELIIGLRNLLGVIKGELSSWLFADSVWVRIPSWLLLYVLVKNLIEPLTTLSGNYPIGDVDTVAEKYIGTWQVNRSFELDDYIQVITVRSDSLDYVQGGHTTKCNSPRISYSFANFNDINGHKVWFPLFDNIGHWLTPVTVFGNQVVTWQCDQYEDGLEYYVRLSEPSERLDVSCCGKTGLLLHDPIWLLDSTDRAFGASMIISLYERDLRLN